MEHIFKKFTKWDSVVQEVLKRYITPKEQKINIINQKDLIIKNLDLKKSQVLEQDLEPIIENSLNYLDPQNGGYKELKISNL